MKTNFPCVALAFAALFVAASVDAAAQSATEVQSKRNYDLGAQAYRAGNYPAAQQAFYRSWVGLHRVSTAIMLARASAAIFKQSRNPEDAKHVIHWVKEAQNENLNPPATDEQNQALNALQSQFATIVASLATESSEVGATASALDADDSQEAKPAKK
jgi:hypothetical protein